MQQKNRWIPWAVGGVIILILVIFSLVGGIGAVVDDTSRRDAATENVAPVQGDDAPLVPQ